MKKFPLVSFCIATYKRPEFLKGTIESILKQKYDNFEIIISEDASEKSAEEVINSFKSKKIIYHKNKNHLGMVESYNKAISLSLGKFVTVLADDDPPTDDMLEVFVRTLKKYPDLEAFWGASFVNITSKKIEKVTHLKQGFHSLVNKKKKYGTVEVLEPKLFFKNFFRQELFPHYQWTASIISRNLLRRINGVPAYDSAHFIDYAYLLKIASKTKFAIINKELAVFALHTLSYGKKQDTLEEYKKGVLGFNKTVSKLAIHFGCEKDYQKFLAEYIIMFLVNRLEFYQEHKYPVNPKNLFNVYAELSNSLPFLNKRKFELYLKLTLYYRFTLIYHTINFIRKTYGYIKM